MSQSIPEVSAQPDDCNGMFILVNCGSCWGCEGYAVADCPASLERGIPGDRIVQCVECTQDTQHDCSTSPEGCRNNPTKKGVFQTRCDSTGVTRNYTVLLCCMDHSR